MKTANRNGFILSIVPFILILVGLAMTVLSSSSRQLSAQTTKQTLAANSINILASGVAWVRANEAFLNKQSAGFTTELDTTAFDISKALCTVRVDSVTDNGVEVAVETVCYKGRQKLRESYKLQI